MTDLAPPTAGLRRITNRSKSPIRTEVVVPIGDDLEVSDYVADQLVSAGLTGVAKAPAKKAATRKG